MNKKYFYWGIASGILVPLFTAVVLLYFFLRPPDIFLSSLHLKNMEKNPVTAASLAGQPVLCNFWATWCKPCLVELPDLLKARDSLKDKVTFIFVSDESIEKVTRFIKEKNLDGHFLCTPVPLDSLGIRARPTTYVYSESGAIVDKHLGPIDYKTVMARFRK